MFLNYVFIQYDLCLVVKGIILIEELIYSILMYSIRVYCNEKLYSFGKNIFDYFDNVFRLFVRCLVILRVNVYLLYD